MTPAESRAMGRAAAVLLVAGLVRWGHDRRQGPPILPDSPDALPELIEEARAVRDEAARRRAPLTEGEKIDPNRADAIDLDRLPGVGPAAAEAIVSAREEGRVFQRVEDLLAVRGIGPGTLEKLRPWVDLERAPPTVMASVQRREAEVLIDLNAATAEELQALPGVGPALAERILELRRTKGRFKQPEDLLEVRGIGPATLKRLLPRVRAGG